MEKCIEKSHSFCCILDFFHQLSLEPASLSPSAKVFRWFKLAPTQNHTLSRPESGFVDGEKSQKDGDEDRLKEEDGCAFDEEGILEGSQSLLESLGTRKRKKLLKLQLGRMTTF